MKGATHVAMPEGHCDPPGPDPETEVLDPRARRGPRLDLMPHEVVFGGFLVLTWARLVLRAGPLGGSSLAFLACLLTTAAVISWAARRPTPWRWRVRLLLYPALMGVSFYLLPPAMALLDPTRADTQLLAWDRALVGDDVNLRIQPWEHPFVTDALMLAYLFFFYYLIAGPAHYCIRSLPHFRQCFAGLFTIYGLGFIGYTMVPAGGPHHFLRFDAPLEGGWLTDLAKPFVDSCSNGMDAFPSIHVAVSLYLLVFDGWHHPARFRRLFAPCVALWVSTVYLRYHYSVDILAGAAVAGVGLAVAAAYARSSAGALALLPMPVLRPVLVTQPVRLGPARPPRRRLDP